MVGARRIAGEPTMAGEAVVTAVGEPVVCGQIRMLDRPPPLTGRHMIIYENQSIKHTIYILHHTKKYYQTHDNG